MFFNLTHFIADPPVRTNLTGLRIDSTKEFLSLLRSEGLGSFNFADLPYCKKKFKLQDKGARILYDGHILEVGSFEGKHKFDIDFMDLVHTMGRLHHLGAKRSVLKDRFNWNWCWYAEKASCSLFYEYPLFEGAVPARLIFTVRSLA